MIIFYYTLISPPKGPISAGGIVLHFSAYAILTFLALHAHERTADMLIIVAFYGTLLEILQNFIGRDASLADLTANIAGICVSAAIIYKINKTEIL